MLEYTLDSFDAVNLIARAESADEAFTYFENHMLKLGFHFVAVTLVRGGPDTWDNGPVFMHTNFPKLWRKQYAENGWAKIDPTLRMARKSRDPFYTTESIAKAANDHCPVVSSTHQIGVVEGIVYPMHHVEGDPGVTFMGSEQDFQLSQKQIEEYQVIARCVFDKIHNFYKADEDDDNPPLSGIEQTILSLIAAGNTNAQITSETGLSAYKIRAHLKRISAMLNTEDRSLMAARAFNLGLLRR